MAEFKNCPSCKTIMIYNNHYHCFECGKCKKTYNYGLQELRPINEWKEEYDSEDYWEGPSLLFLIMKGEINMNMVEKLEEIKRRLNEQQFITRTKGKACAITKIEEAIMWLKYDKNE